MGSHERSAEDTALVLGPPGPESRGPSVPKTNSLRHLPGVLVSMSSGTTVPTTPAAAALCDLQHAGLDLVVVVEYPGRRPRDLGAVCRGDVR